MESSSVFNAKSFCKTVGPVAVIAAALLLGVTNPFILASALIAFYACLYAPSLGANLSQARGFA